MTEEQPISQTGVRQNPPSINISIPNDGSEIISLQTADYIYYTNQIKAIVAKIESKLDGLEQIVEDCEDLKTECEELKTEVSEIVSSVDLTYEVIE